MSDASTGLQDIFNGRQHDRLLRLSFPHDDGPAVQLRVNRLEAYESLSKPFEFTVELLADNPDVQLKDLQGKMMCVQLVRRDGSMRYFTGIVFNFALKTVDGGVSYYEAKLGPWYQYLALRKDNYMFHYTNMYQQTASIFGDYGDLADWDWRVQGAADVLTDCCQFDESDSNFLTRRWVANGIYYWFEHSESGHKLVLSDDSNSSEPIDGGPEVRFQSHGGAAEEDGIGTWSPARRIVQSAVALASFDFKAPQPAFASLPTVNKQGEVAAIESYEYAGAYGYKDGGRTLAQLRMEEMESAGKQFDGGGNNRYLMPGRWFRLTDHFDGGDAQSAEFLIVEVHHSASNNYHVKTNAESHYENRVSASRKVVPWRASREYSSVETRIHGIQTATVVGPAGEEIHTDEYGRVRVQFHWDRAGANDEKSSAWIRVATPWAGPNFGMTMIPRIGTEVLVQFLDGNPDRPIITGMVPNADTMPPWSLPGNKTQSGILTRSTPGGAYENANALRFEDMKGKEQLWLHAEKDQLTEVEHDEDKWVGNDRRKTIDRDETTLVKRDRTETVDRDETITVHRNRTETVDNNETITIHNNRGERVDHNETISIGDNRTETVGKNETVSIGISRTTSIGKDNTTTIGMNKTETIGMASAQTVGMGRMDNVGLGYDLNVGMGMVTMVGVDQMTQVGEDIATSAGKNIQITAGDSLTITVGKATLVMKKDGSIAINGSKINVSASGVVTLKGSKIHNN